MGQAFGKTKVPTTAKGKAELRSKMSDEQIATLRAQFDDLDADKSGFIDRDELLAGLGKLKIKANADEVNDRANRAALVKRVDAMLEVADTNKDGKIDFDEFVIAYSVLKKMGNETSTSGFMNRYLGGVGALAFFVGKQYKEKTDMVGVKDKDEEEARRMVEELTDSQRTQLRGEFEKFDTDGNGTIEPAELMEAIRSLGVRVDADRENTDASDAQLQTRVDRMMELADINSDGKLDFEEFVYAIKTMEKISEEKSTSNVMVGLLGGIGALFTPMLKRSPSSQMREEKEMPAEVLGEQAESKVDLLGDGSKS